MRDMSKMTGDPIHIAHGMLEEVLKDPEVSGLVERMVADPELSREELFSTAFAQGVITVLEILSQGPIDVNLGDRN